MNLLRQKTLDRNGETLERLERHYKLRGKERRCMVNEDINGSAEEGRSMIRE